MEKKDANYELMKVTKEEISSCYPNGIDEVTVEVVKKYIEEQKNV